MPEIERLRQKYEPQGLGFVALALEPDGEAVRSTASKWGIRMPVATVRPEALHFDRAVAVPSILFIDRAGIIVAAASGEQQISFIEKWIRVLLKS